MATLPIGPFKPAAPARAAVITFPQRGISEDWLAVGIGLLVFVLSLGLLFGIEVSMGSACAAGAVEPSHVLRAMGRSVADARSSLRISLGWNNTAPEIEAAAALIPHLWRRVQAAEPLSEAGAR